MNRPKNLRAIDQKSFTTKNRKDFVARKHGIKSQQVYSFILTLVVIAFGVAFLVYNETLYGSIVCIIAGALLFVFGKITERHKKALETTEFLSALFSSVIGEDYKFSIIVKRDDAQIVYLNNGFQKTFPDMVPIADRSLPLLMKLYNVSAQDQKSVLAAVKGKDKHQVKVKMLSGKENKKSTISLNVEPIARPAGFCLIRGN